MIDLPVVERARRRLTSLDFFDKIEFREDPGSAPDRIVLVVDVQEKSTGSVSFSVGYSTAEAVVGSVSLQERNFLGKGQNVKLNTSLSFKRQSVDFSFTEPYFMGMPISAGFDVFATSTDNQATSSYNSQQVGGALRTGFALDEYSSLNFKYGLAWREVSGVDESIATPAIIDMQGTSIKSSVGAAYTWDNLDSPVKPTNGFRGQIDSEIGLHLAQGELSGGEALALKSAVLTELEPDAQARTQALTHWRQTQIDQTPASTDPRDAIYLAAQAEVLTQWRAQAGQASDPATLQARLSRERERIYGQSPPSP